MIYDVYRVGKAISGIADTDIDPLLMPETPKNITNIIWLEFSQTEEVEYHGVAVEDYIQDKAQNYLLRKASANGANYGPSAQLTEAKKTLEKKIAAWFKDASIEAEDNKELFLGINNFISANIDALVEEINDHMAKGKGVQNMLAVRINGLYPLEVSSFFQYYSKRVLKKIVGEENHTGTCCLCGRKDINLLPTVGVFKFYTHDKPGFISGGFSEEDIWRNCPVCISCEPVLREGKKYMLEHLKFKFYGFDYYLIPSSTCNEDMQDYLVYKLENISHKSFSFQEAADTEFSSLSGDMFEELAADSDINSYRIIFFKKENSAERILLDVKDVFPSRFAELYSAKYHIDKIYEEITGEKFNFRYFRQYLSKSDSLSNTYDLDGIFLSLTHAIFTKEKILLNSLLVHYMRSIRRAFLNDEYLYHTTLRAWIGIQYLKEIGCIDYGKEESYMDKRLEQILEPYSAGQNSNLIKGLVLTGILVQKVLDIQTHELSGSTPFTSRLKGLRMRSQDVKGLIKEIYGKMMEYKKYSKASKLIMESLIDILPKQDECWNLSVDEMNFNIVSGMVISNRVYDKIKEAMNDGSSKEE